MMRHLSGWIILFFCLPLQADPSVTIRDAWIREAPPGVAVLAAYMTIENNGARGYQLMSASSTDFASVEIHATQVTDGTARMTHLKSLELPARGKLVFAPGASHLMLMQPRRALRAGDQVTLTLRFSGDLVVTTRAKVQNDATMPGHHHH